MKKGALLFFILINFIINAQTPNWTWAKGVGGTLGQSSIDKFQTVGYNLVTDKSGNVYSVGIFQTPTMLVGTYTLVNSDNSGNTPNLFTIKHDALGNVLWAKNAIGSVDGGWMDVAIDDASNIYITGGFVSQTMIFDSKILTKTNNEGMDDIFIAKYSSDGNFIWAKSFGGSSDDYGNALNIDAANNILITGNFKSAQFAIGTYTLTNDFSGNPNMFIAKFDSSGTVLYSKNIGKSCTIATPGNNIISDSITIFTSLADITNLK